MVSLEEVLVADLIARHGDKVLQVEARHQVGGSPKLLVVLDLDPPAMAAEQASLSAEQARAVELVDHATFATMQRLAAAGMLQFTHNFRLLHRSAAFVAVTGETTPPDGRAPQFMDEAERALRMAKVLATGGFPEEAPLLLAKALQKACAALMTECAELSAGATAASDSDIRRLIERKAVPLEAQAILDAIQSNVVPADSEDIGALLASAERCLAAIGAPGVRLAA